MRVKFYIAALMISFANPAWANGDLHFTDTNGKPANISQNRLITFWSPDCAPCLLEMEILPNIAKQNIDLPMAIISLKDLEHTRARLTPMPDNIKILVAQEESKSVLTAFGNDMALALPYSVMLDKKGNICRKYYGIISPDKIKEWRKEC